ncbi:hypothetical protein J7K28_05725 [Candidatus Aerophobetes bacterium]|nr:hypothetical protein [Candidatus Aerophobetes bacterium]
MRILKTILIVLGLFILFVGLMLIRRGILAKDKFFYLREVPKVWMKKIPLFSSEVPQEESACEEEIILSLKNIQEKQEKLAKKEEKLKEFQTYLSLQREELKRESERIVALKEELEKDIEEERIKYNERISWLASIYEEMQPEEASPIIEKLSDELAVSVLSQMEERQVGKILGIMDLSRAIELSEKIGKDVITQLLKESEKK